MDAIAHLQNFNDDALENDLHVSSSTSSYITIPEDVIDTSLRRRRHSYSPRRFRHLYRLLRSKRQSKLIPRPQKPTKTFTYRHRTRNIPKAAAIPEIIIQDLPNQSDNFQDLGNLTSRDSFVCSIYITSYDTEQDHINEEIKTDRLIEKLRIIATGKIRVQKTYRGIIVAFTKEPDVEKVLQLSLQNIFEGPVQVAKFHTGECNFKKRVTIKDVPWCISNCEIRQALKQQGITSGKVIRTRSYVKIEVLSSLDVHRLMEEGLNFFGYTSFPAIIDNNVNQFDMDIIQCFKCQGFWHTSTHCRQMPRCVRCGENHEVEYCPRLRNDPICCHCGGPHHAAFKMCPVRLQHINSTYIGFQLTNCNPLRTIPHNIF